MENIYIEGDILKLNLGQLNELKFTEHLNNKKICELNPMFYDCIVDLFNNIDINKDDVITCNKNKYPTKTDIFIKIKNHQKRISIKMGYCNSVHIEPISSFIHFLIENGVEKDVIIEYLKYHYADGTTNGTGNNRISIEKYKKYNQDKIDKINLHLNNEKLIKKSYKQICITR